MSFGRSDRYLDTWVSVPEAAGLAGVSTRTLRRLMDAGELAYAMPRKQRRVRRRDALAVAAERQDRPERVLAVVGEDLLSG